MKKRDNRKWLEIKILELAYKGHNYQSISETMHVSLGKISSILSKINQDAKQEIKTWIDDKTPLEYKKSLMLLEFILNKAIHIAETSDDERCVLQALNTIEQTDAAKRNLLSDTTVINAAIGHIEKIKLDEMKQRVEEKLDEAIAKDKTANSISSKNRKIKANDKKQAKETVF